MHGAKFRQIGLTLVTGASLAVACGGDDSGGGGNKTSTGSVTSTTGGSTVTTSQTQSSTSSGTTNTSGGTNTTTTGSGGSGGTMAAGGSGGMGGMCEDEGGTTAGGAGEGGAAGAAPVAENGYTFVSEDELSDWGIQSADGCEGCVDTAELSWSCAVMEVTINWPAAANDETQKVILENLSPSDTELWDLSGKTVVASIRMTSPQVGNNGYDIDLGLSDFGDGSDWTYSGTCWAGDSACPAARHNTELWADDPNWSLLSLPADADDTDFDSSGIRKFALQIATKYWTDDENPPTFDYDSAPVTFEVGMYVW